MSAQEAASQVWRPEHLRLAISAASVALWSWSVDSDRLTMDERAFEMWGLPWSSDVAFEDLSAHLHPADRDRVRAAFTATRSIAGPYEIDFRTLVGDEVRWISARGHGADEGIVDGVMFGIFLDVTERKQAERQMAQQLDELRRWQTVTLGREERIADLKRDLNALAARLGQPPPYPSAEPAP